MYREKLNRASRHHPTLSALCAGGLLGIGFVFPALWWLYLPGAIVFLQVIRRAPSLYRALFYGAVAMTVKAAVAMVCFWSIVPIAWMDVGGLFAQILATGLYWTTFSVWIGLGGVVLGGVVYLLREYWWWYFVVIPMWLVSEILGSLSFSFFTGAPNIPITIDYGVGYIGYHVAQHAVLFHGAAWGGVYVLSLLAASLAVLCYYLWTVRSHHTLYLAGGLVVFILIGYIPNSGAWLAPPAVSVDPVRIAVVGTNVPASLEREQDIFGQRQYQITRALMGVVGQSVTHVVLPEDVRFMPSERAPFSAHSFLRQLFRDEPVMLIDSARYQLDDGLYTLRGRIYQNDSEDIWHVDKQYLVPQGEYIPVLYATIFRALGYGEAVAGLQEKLGYVPGPYRDQSGLPDTAPRTIFCFESVSPRGVRTALAGSEQVPFVYHPLSHARFNNARICWRSLDTMLRIQARWNQVPIVSSANRAPSNVYYPDGSIRTLIDHWDNDNDMVRVKVFDL